MERLRIGGSRRIGASPCVDEEGVMGGSQRGWDVAAAQTFDGVIRSMKGRMLMPRNSCEP